MTYTLIKSRYNPTQKTKSEKKPKLDSAIKLPSNLQSFKLNSLSGNGCILYEDSSKKIIDFLYLISECCRFSIIT